MTSLREDGSRKPYTSPNGGTRAERYFTLPYDYWTGEQRGYTTLGFGMRATSVSAFDHRTLCAGASCLLARPSAGRAAGQAAQSPRIGG